MRERESARARERENARAVHVRDPIAARELGAMQNRLSKGCSNRRSHRAHLLRSTVTGTVESSMPAEACSATSSSTIGQTAEVDQNNALDDRVIARRRERCGLCCDACQSALGVECGARARRGFDLEFSMISGCWVGPSEGWCDSRRHPTRQERTDGCRACVPCVHGHKGRLQCYEIAPSPTRVTDLGGNTRSLKW